MLMLVKIYNAIWVWKVVFTRRKKIIIQENFKNMLWERENITTSCILKSIDLIGLSSCYIILNVFCLPNFGELESRFEVRRQGDFQTTGT